MTETTQFCLNQSGWRCGLQGPISQRSGHCAGRRPGIPALSSPWSSACPRDRCPATFSAGTLDFFTRQHLLTLRQHFRHMDTANAPMWAPREQPRLPSDGEAVVIIDVDQFAAIRQRHGDTAVDQVSLAVAEQLRHLLRSQDRLAISNQKRNNQRTKLKRA